MINDSPGTGSAPEFTLRSILVGSVVALITGLAYPYIVLKLGFGPNISVVAAFFGFIALVLILRARGTNARENNIVQTMTALTHAPGIGGPSQAGWREQGSAP